MSHQNLRWTPAGPSPDGCNLNILVVFWPHCRERSFPSLAWWEHRYFYVPGTINPIRTDTPLFCLIKWTEWRRGLRPCSCSLLKFGVTWWGNAGKQILKTGLKILMLEFKFWKLIYFFVLLGLELRTYTLSHCTSPFCVRYFQDRVHWTICLGCLQTWYLPPE
jgi:hypothetical protein